MAPISGPITGLLSLLLLCPGALAQHNHVARQDAATTTTSAAITAVTGCHLHDTTVYCMVGSEEYVVDTTVTATEELPASYTGCHTHGSDLYCLSPDGDDVAVSLPAEEGEAGHDEHDDHDGEESGESEEPAGENCHFHAGVEHCVSSGESESASSDGSSTGSSASRCNKVDRDYNVPLRIGLIFAILATSSLGVFAPIFLVKYLPAKLNVVLITMKQFGTGIIISTAFVHLFVHATLMFENQCLGELKYEGTAAAILMAGLFISFLVEYFGERFMRSRLNKKMINGSPEGYSIEKHNASLELVNITVMEAGIIFHSLIIGVTLVVSGDSFFLTLFIVIVFHQFFEGLALGSRIAALGTNKHYALAGLGHHSEHQHGPGHHHHHSHNPEQTSDSLSKAAGGEATPSLNGSAVNREEPEAAAGKSNFPMSQKMILATCFALVTPIGMAIGTGALSVFNGNDPATVIAIGTLDAFSAGILVWVGVVEMWAADWMGGEMAEASAFTTTMGLFGLIAGMALMSLLGKWA
ncbi:unnamed protein product [Parascedosporium putredinis]|uniref:Zinc/iron permease n=1 Tax=Parascedosporium putredinis TaxID=1442378 RepID=A0A9P1MBQ5_9PEZI|nr:unnamed protein product [Parascedosporium putredinis]CAI8000026.1 unnamed protein product [Parascedosporium putredinis]